MSPINSFPPRSTKPQPCPAAGPQRTAQPMRLPTATVGSTCALMCLGHGSNGAGPPSEVSGVQWCLWLSPRLRQQGPHEYQPLTHLNSPSPTVAPLRRGAGHLGRHAVHCRNLFHYTLSVSRPGVRDPPLRAGRVAAHPRHGRVQPVRLCGQGEPPGAFGEPWSFWSNAMPRGHVEIMVAMSVTISNTVLWNTAPAWSLWHQLHFRLESAPIPLLHWVSLLDLSEDDTGTSWTAHLSHK